MSTDTKALRSKIYKHIGKRIKAKRNSVPKMSQEQLAVAVGMKRASIAKIEAGDQRFPVDKLYIFADALGIEDPLSLLPSKKVLSRPTPQTLKKPKEVHHTDKIERGEQEWIEATIRKIKT